MACARRCAVPAQEGQMILNPLQFIEAVSTTQAIGGHLAAIVFPIITDQQRGIELTNLPPDEARTCLAGSVFGSASRGHTSNAFGGCPPNERFEGEFLSGILARHVPVLRCALGPDAYAKPASAPSIVEKLLKWTKA